MTTLQTIQDIVAGNPDGRLMLADPIKVKSAPHQLAFTVYGLWTGPDGLYVLEGSGEWHGPLLPEQVNGQLMINSIYQRVKAIEYKASVVVARYDTDVNATIFE